MFNILVVDDNKIERVGIINTLKQKNYPFYIFEAKNGLIALEVIKNQDIDILFTDLKMPKMNGIELITEAQKINSDINSIIYSAYSDFTYAQSALKLGVVQYLLKPMSIKQFEKVFNEIISIATTKKLDQITTELALDIKNSQLDKKISQLINLNTYQYMQLSKSKVTVHSQHSKIIRDEFGITLQLNNQKKLRFSTKIENLDKKIEQCITVYDHLISKSLTENYQYLENELSKNFFFNIDYRDLSKKTELSDFPITELLNTLYISILDSDERRITYYLNQIKKVALSQQKMTVDELRKRLTIFSNKFLLEPLLVFSENLCTSENEYFKTFEDFEILVYTTNETKSPVQSNSYLINRIYELIQSNISNINLSVNWLAQILDKTPNYLSSTFKKETGTNINQTIGKIRISLAQSLLTNSNLKINEIAQRCGFEDSSYFIQFFKKKNNVTPLQYRKKGIDYE